MMLSIGVVLAFVAGTAVSVGWLRVGVLMLASLAMLALSYAAFYIGFTEPFWQRTLPWRAAITSACATAAVAALAFVLQWIDKKRLPAVFIGALLAAKVFLVLFGS